MKQWFVVNTKTHEETKAMTNLNQQGFNTYLPRYKKTRRHARRTDTVMAPLFPKYLFVEFDLGMESWSRINSTFGVSKLIKFGSTPIPLPQKLINEIRARISLINFCGSGIGVEPNFINLLTPKVELMRDQLSIPKSNSTNRYFGKSGAITVSVRRA